MVNSCEGGGHKAGSGPSSLLLFFISLIPPVRVVVHRAHTYCTYIHSSTASFMGLPAQLTSLSAKSARVYLHVYRITYLGHFRIFFFSRLPSRARVRHGQTCIHAKILFHSHQISTSIREASHIEYRTHSAPLCCCCCWDQRQRETIRTVRKCRACGFQGCIPKCPSSQT